jgi:hypothetical protein
MEIALCPISEQDQCFSGQKPPLVEELKALYKQEEWLLYKPKDPCLYSAEKNERICGMSQTLMPYSYKNTPGVYLFMGFGRLKAQKHKEAPEHVGKF